MHSQHIYYGEKFGYVGVGAEYGVWSMTVVFKGIHLVCLQWQTSKMKTVLYRIPLHIQLPLLLIVWWKPEHITIHNIICRS